MKQIINQKPNLLVTSWWIHTWYTWWLHTCHMNESCHTWHVTRDMSHTTWHISGNDPMNAHTPYMSQQRVMSHANEWCHAQMSHVTFEWCMSHVNELMDAYMPQEGVMSHMNESCHIWTNWCMHTCHSNESREKYERVMSRTNESRHTWLSHVTYTNKTNHRSDFLKKELPTRQIVVPYKSVPLLGGVVRNFSTGTPQSHLCSNSVIQVTCQKSCQNSRWYSRQKVCSIVWRRSLQLSSRGPHAVTCVVIVWCIFCVKRVAKTAGVIVTNKFVPLFRGVVRNFSAETQYVTFKVMSHMYNASCHLWMRHVTYVNETCHTCEYVVSHNVNGIRHATCGDWCITLHSYSSELYVTWLIHTWHDSFTATCEDWCITLHS